MPKTIGVNFSDDVKINRFKLEEENEIQPSLYHLYASQQAEARTAKDAASDKVKLVKSQRELHYRRNPPDDLKITESVVTALVEQDTVVQEALAEYRKVQEILSVLDAAVSSLDTRKAALNNLTELFVKDYYNGKGKEESASDAVLPTRRRRQE